MVEGINDTLDILKNPDLRTGANLAPTESVSGLTLNAGKLELVKFRWGLIPSWSRRDPARERPLINARIETVGEKPSFKESFTSDVPSFLPADLSSGEARSGDGRYRIG